MYLSSKAAVNEDTYETNGTLANACLPSTLVSSIYSGKYTVARVINNLLATYSIATLNKIAMLIHDIRRFDEKFDSLAGSSTFAFGDIVRSKRLAFRKMWKKMVAVRPKVVRIRAMFCKDRITCKSFLYHLFFLVRTLNL